MNCFIEIGNESYPGTFIGKRGNVYDVQMAGPHGYDYVMSQMNCHGRILVRETKDEYLFTAVSSLNPDTYSVSFQ